MANVKVIRTDWSQTGITVYCMVTRDADGYFLRSSDGAFAFDGTGANSYNSLTEDSIVKGRYRLNESRTVWNDGLYLITIYKQVGGSPTPTSDTVIGTGNMYISSDTEVILDNSVATVGSDLKRALGLMHENIYIDEPLYDANNNLVSARVRIYADAVDVGSSNNVIGTYQISSVGTGAGTFTFWKQVQL
jgi:hypothetical protein